MTRWNVTAAQCTIYENNFYMKKQHGLPQHVLIYQCINQILIIFNMELNGSANKL